MTPLPRLMVAPNGARHGKAHHPKLPITLPEIVDCARDCHEAGADGLHLHLRDDKGLHLLDAGAYAEALAVLGQEVPQLVVQITSEAAGLYASQYQRRVALDSGARLVSASIREIMVDTEPAEAAAFYTECADRGIAIQHILYNAADLDLLIRVLPDDLLSGTDLQLLFVLGHYTVGGVSSPDDILPFLQGIDRAGLRPDWAVCAFGPTETDCLVAAFRQGGKMRVGFENSIWRADGHVAEDNAQRVLDIREAIGAVPCQGG